jgi:hypothetical protein
MSNNDIDLNVEGLQLGDETTQQIEADSDETTSGTAISEGPTSSAPIDEDDIKIGDRKAPIIMLFGPPTSGKSMTLVRLARYLRKLDYTVKADTTFKYDATYKERCAKFHKNLTSKEALDGNALNEFLMVKIIKHGATVCQILEAPGEHYFDPKKPEDTSARNFRPYLTEIIRSLPNRKIWVFITEAEWNVHPSVKDAYVDRIRNCKHQLLRNSDRVIILYNKVDQKEELFENGQLHASSAEKAMKDEYVRLPIIFKNSNPITSLWRPYNYKFVPFCTGYYTKQVGGRPKYKESEEKYPRQLWDQIIKCIKG